MSDTFTYTINWGDGSEVDTGTVTSDSVMGGHTYTEHGPFTISVTVRDDDGGEHTETTSIQIQDILVDISGSPTVVEGTEYTLGLSTNVGSDHWLIDWGIDGDEQFIADTSL